MRVLARSTASLRALVTRERGIEIGRILIVGLITLLFNSSVPIL